MKLEKIVVKEVLFNDDQASATLEPVTNGKAIDRSKSAIAPGWFCRYFHPSSYILLQFCLWFSTAVFGTIINKTLIQKFPYPITITALHLLAGIVFDAVITAHDKPRAAFTRKSYVSIMPAAFCLIGSKVFTYISYGKVPASLTHTVKATSPIFSVLLCRYYLKTKVPSLAIAALVPIAVGVTLSSVTEINFEVWGFLAALVSTLIGVLQVTFTKKGMMKVEPNPIILHLHMSLLAIVVAVPIAVFADFRSIYQNYIVKDTFYTQLNLPQMLLMSMTVMYVQTMASLQVLSSVVAVTHQVSCTLKRLFVIICSILYFGNQVSIMNFVGITVAMCGFCCYGIANKLKREFSLPLYSTPNVSSPTSGSSPSKRSLCRSISLPNIIETWNSAKATLESSFGSAVRGVS